MVSGFACHGSRHQGEATTPNVDASPSAVAMEIGEAAAVRCDFLTDC